jgi:hypothetical protein
MHPRVIEDLMREMTPREKWQLRHREERILRKGKQPEKLMRGQPRRLGG